jgi:hypothetical protein
MIAMNSPSPDQLNLPEQITAKEFHCWRAGSATRIHPAFGPPEALHARARRLAPERRIGTLSAAQRLIVVIQ